MIANQDRQDRTLSRRRFFAVAGAVGMSASLTACGGGTDDGRDDTGSWEFPDGRGGTVRTEATPRRVVAFTGSAGALVDYGVREPIVGIFGEAHARDMLGDLDPDSVTIVGDAWGQFDIEKYATLEPDLLVTDSYVPGRLWYVPDDNLSKIESANPNLIAVEIGGQRLPDIIARYRALAAALGAATATPAVAAAEQRFAAASHAVRDAVAARPGLRVLAASATPELFYASGLQPAALADRPVWRSLPAVTAGQVVPWSPIFRFSHAATAPLLERLATTIRDAKKVR